MGIDIMKDPNNNKHKEQKPREKWQRKFLSEGSLNDDENLISNIENDFDQDEWTWEQGQDFFF